MIHGFWNLEFIGLSARKFIGSWNLRRHFEEKKKAATRVGANQWSTRHKCRLDRQTAFDELLVERKCQSARNCPCHGNGGFLFSILLGEWTRVVIFFFLGFEISAKCGKINTRDYSVAIFPFLLKTNHQISRIVFLNFCRHIWNLLLVF
jgi:hypothetical protein